MLCLLLYYQERKKKEEEEEWERNKIGSIQIRWMENNENE